MSTSDLYILNGKSTTHIAEFRNGWGSAPMAWDHLAAKYIAEKPVYSLAPGHLRKVWALHDDPRLARHEKIVLMMTFDKAFVPLSHLEDAGECCEKFGAECEDGARVNHWLAIGKALRAEAGKRHSRHARGIVLSPTSVSDCWVEPTAEWLSGAWPIYDAA